MTMAPLFSEHKSLIPDYGKQDFSQSDKVMSCVITFGISLLWSEEDAKIRAEKMKIIIEDLI